MENMKMLIEIVAKLNIKLVHLLSKILLMAIKTFQLIIMSIKFNNIRAKLKFFFEILL